MEIVHTAWVETPVGRLRVASTERGVGYLELPHASGRGLAGWLKRCLPRARCEENEVRNRAVSSQVLEYLEGRRSEFDLPLDLRGTPFQKRVWEALLQIPYGETRSYQEIARTIRKPKAARSVGTANGANPLSLIVPCHRVVATGGRLGGYAGGLELKARLLAMESAHHPHQGSLF